MHSRLTLFKMQFHTQLCIAMHLLVAYTFQTRAHRFEATKRPPPLKSQHFYLKYNLFNTFAEQRIPSDPPLTRPHLAWYRILSRYKQSHCWLFIHTASHQVVWKIGIDRSLSRTRSARLYLLSIVERICFGTLAVEFSQQWKCTDRWFFNRTLGAF